MPVVVSNTSPILNLAIVGQLELMRQQFGQVQIPPSVLAELKVQEERSGSKEIQVALDTGWIQVQEIDLPLYVQLLQQTLDRGVEIDLNRDPKLNRSTVYRSLRMSRLQNRFIAKFLSVIG